MKHYRNALAALFGLFAVFAGPALWAADIYGGSTKDAPGPDLTRALNWTGFYVGGSVGYAMANTALDIGGFAELDGIGSEGFQGCGIVGARRQFGVMVVGLEGRGCVSKIETDLSIGGTSVAGYEEDYSYAGYVTIGTHAFGGLASLAGGLKNAHVEGTGLLLNGWDDDFTGFSGGLIYEIKLSQNINLGLEALYDAYEEQSYGGLKVDPSQLNVGVRLTTQLN